MKRRGSEKNQAQERIGALGASPVGGEKPLRREKPMRVAVCSLV